MKSTQLHGGIIVAVILFLLAIVALLYVNLSPQKEVLTGRVIDLNSPLNQEPDESSQTNSYETQKCKTEGVDYKISNEGIKSMTCNEMDKKCSGDSPSCRQFCSDKTISYSLDVSNLDQNEGPWTIKVQFYKEGMLYRSVPITQRVEPKTTKTFTISINVIDDVPGGNADQTFSADYAVVSTPTKKVCESVTP